MAFKPLISPHVHVKSFDSGSTPEKFAQRELELNTGYITVTDHGSLEAVRQVYDLTKTKKFNSLKMIPGLEAYVRSDDCPILQKNGIEKVKGSYRHFVKYTHITLHAQDEAAFSAMSIALSDADLRAEKHGSERKPLFDWNTLENLGGYNITGTSGCLIGMVSRFLLDHNNPYLAMEYYEKTRSCFKPGNFFVEVFPHVCDRNWDTGVFVKMADGSERKFSTWKNLKTAKGEIKAEELAKSFLKNDNAHEIHKNIYEVMENRAWKPLETPIQLFAKSVERREGFLMNECRPWCPDGDVQKGCNLFLLKMAEKYGDPVIISDDSHQAYPEEKIVQDIKLAQMGDWKFSTSHHRLDSNHAWQYFNDKMGIEQKTFEKWLDNAHGWAHKFDNFNFAPRKSLPTSFYPSNTLAHTMELIKQHGRMDWDNPVYVNRLNQEIQLLHKNGTIDLLPYFMIDEEVCSLYASHGELTGCGRGSAAGLLLCYLLEITHIDPIKYELSLDRFLTLDRIQSGKLPDIDQDLNSRNLLVAEKPTYTLTLDDGSTKELPVDKIVKTSQGDMTIKEAFEKQVEVFL